MSMRRLLVTVALSAVATLAPAQDPAPAATQWTVVLLKDQLCAPPAGFADFVAANTTATRTAVRPRTRTALKKRALLAQATFASVLPPGTDVLGTWPAC